MKTIVLVFAMVLSSITFAEVIREDNYNTDLGVKATDVKCSFFGKVKMKLKGLNEGKIGKSWLKADRFDGKCRDHVKTIKAQLNSRNNTVAAEVAVAKVIRKREVFHHDRDFPRIDVDFFKVFEVECHTEEITDLAVTLPRVLVNDKQVVLKRTQVKTLDIDYGYCR